MQIESHFALSLPPAEAHELLLDLDRVAPCMPGAALGAATQDGGRAVEVTVKLGAMKFVYAGTVRIAERDDDARSATLSATAREKRGQGNAGAQITMTVSDGEDGGSLVAFAADIQLSGRAAQSGRGIVEDVTRRMIDQMTQCIEAAATSGGVESGPTGPST
jgi:carbon monoxide dehydrogenase subunit G